MDDDELDAVALAARRIRGVDFRRRWRGGAAGQQGHQHGEQQFFHGCLVTDQVAKCSAMRAAAWCGCRTAWRNDSAGGSAARMDCAISGCSVDAPPASAMG